LLLNPEGSDLFFRLGTQTAARIAEQQVNLHYIFISLAHLAGEIRLNQFLTRMERKNCG